MTGTRKFRVGNKVRIHHNADIQDVGAVRMRDAEVELTIMDILKDRDVEYPIKAGVGEWSYWFTEPELVSIQDSAPTDGNTAA